MASEVTAIGALPQDAAKYYNGTGAWTVPAGGSEAWPVGSIFLSVVATNPNTLLGYGTWAAVAQGRVLVSLDSGQTEFDTVRETGGAKTVTLSAAQIPAHTHPSIQVQGGTTASVSGTHIMTSTATGGSSRVAITPEKANANTGGDGAHENLPPYFVCFMWERLS